MFYQNLNSSDLMGLFENRAIKNKRDTLDRMIDNRRHQSMHLTDYNFPQDQKRGSR